MKVTTQVPNDNPKEVLYLRRDDGHGRFSWRPDQLQMKLKFACISLIAIFMMMPCLMASQISGLPISELYSKSNIVVVGSVLRMVKQDQYSDVVEIQINSFIKGAIRQRETTQRFTLRLRNKGVKDFDPTLKEGDMGVFFLESIEEGKGKLRVG